MQIRRSIKLNKKLREVNNSGEKTADLNELLPIRRPGNQDILEKRQNISLTFTRSKVESDIIQFFLCISVEGKKKKGV